MKRSFAGLLAVAAIAGILAASATDASAQWHARGWGWRGPGWGPGVAAGVIGGAIVAGAIIASMPPGYVVYPGYAQPVYASGCYWASQPIYDPAGHVIGYTGQPVQVCPGYVPPAPPPGYAAGPAIAGPGPQPGGDPTAYCRQRFKSYDPKTGTYLGTDGQRHPCP
jgi:BA14K-like protein